MDDLPPIPADLQLGPFPHDELWEGVDLLLRCDCAADPNDRQRLIAQLRHGDAAFDVRYSPSDRSHLRNLLEACLKEPRRLDRLARAVEDYEGPGTSGVVALRELFADLRAIAPPLRRRHRREILRALAGAPLAPARLAALARRAAPPRRGAAPGEGAGPGLEQAIDWLADSHPDPDAGLVHPLAALLELLARELPDRAERLRLLARAVAAEAGVDDAALERQRRALAAPAPDAAGQRAVVLIDVEPDPLTPGAFSVRGWLWEQRPPPRRDGSAALCAAAPPASGAELRRQVARAVAAGVSAAEERLYLPEQIEVELLLPREGLAWDVDQWPMADRTARRLGRAYRLSLRWRDRADHARPRAGLPAGAFMAWRARWAQLERLAAGERPRPLVCWLDDRPCADDGDRLLIALAPGGAIHNPAVEALSDALDGHGSIVCLALPYPPPELPADPETDILYRALDRGTAVALWLRGAPADPAALRDALAGLLAPDALRLLPERVWELRRAAGSSDPHHIGTALSLLWDDPNCQPPAEPAGAALS